MLVVLRLKPASEHGTRHVAHYDTAMFARGCTVATEGCLYDSPGCPIIVAYRSNSGQCPRLGSQNRLPGAFWAVPACSGSDAVQEEDVRKATQVVACGLMFV